MTPRRVLLFGTGHMVTDHVARAGSLLAGDPRISRSLHVTGDPLPVDEHAAIASRHRLPLAPSPFGAPWDLVVFGTHYHAARFPREVPKIQIGHGLTGGKVDQKYGEVFRFGRPFVVHPDGEPIYDTLCVASHHEARRALDLVPELEGRIAVVGNIAADELLALDGRRDEVRKALGFGAAETTVALISTWGPESLAETIGHDLLTEALAIQARSSHRFVALLHPHLWGREHQPAEPWDDRLLELARKGLMVRKPMEPLAPYLAAADVAIADHGSVTASYALLGRPLAMSPFSPGAVTDDSPVTVLRSVCPQLAQPADLERTLATLTATPLPPELQAIGPMLLSHPGQGAARLAGELYRLLGLEPPA